MGNLDLLNFKWDKVLFKLSRFLFIGSERGIIMSLFYMCNQVFLLVSSYSDHKIFEKMKNFEMWFLLEIDSPRVRSFFHKEKLVQ